MQVEAIRALAYCFRSEMKKIDLDGALLWLGFGRGVCVVLTRLLETKTRAQGIASQTD